MIDLHTVPTPNGHKVSIMLEEIGLPYRVIEKDLLKGEQFAPEFLRLNPNNKCPVIVDTEPEEEGEPLVVFESGAILVYLAEKSGRLLSSRPTERYWNETHRQLRVLEHHLGADDFLAGEYSIADIAC